jgi:sarcosine oxidase subunit beta
MEGAVMSKTRSPLSPVIIGGGVMGCSIAFHMARAGHQPVVVDKGPAAGAGSTSASSALIRFNYSAIDAVKLAWESAQLWQRWPDFLGVGDDLGHARLIRTGMLVLDSPATTLERVQQHFDQVGIPYERLDAAALHARFAELDLGRFLPPHRVDDPAFWTDATGPEITAYITPDAGFIDDPMLAAHNLMVAAEHFGARFRFRTEVCEIRKRGDRVHDVVLKDGTTLETSVVVNAAGPHSSVVNRMAGVATTGIQTRALRQEVHVVPAPQGCSLDEGGVAIADADLGTYLRPHLGGSFIIGGLEPECDPLVWIADPDVFDENPTPEVWEAQTTRAARRITTLGVPNRPSGIAALYDVSDDWLPVYDRTDLDGFYVAIGTSGNQFKNAPMVGLLMKDLIEACEEGRDHDTDPVVVNGPVTGLAIDLGQFSRRRTVHATTNSVLG